jgi:uncharacterized protein (DUF1800 family)
MTSGATAAVNRFGLGARPGELESAASDPHGWLEAQLEGGPLLVEAEGLLPSHEVLTQLVGLREERRKARGQSQDKEGLAALGARRRELQRDVLVAEAVARVSAAVATPRSFVERLTQFWANHFAVSADKPAVTGVAGAFEREAIRPHVLGRFEELLVAVERHPAMLLYLDNHLSAGRDSAMAQRRARAERRRSAESEDVPATRKRGLNENLAREILELHTLGVGGGYTQEDVTAFAEVLTGWSVSGQGRDAVDGESGHFEFRPAWHQPGAKTVLGQRYPQDGVWQGQAVLRDVARHPATARHLATKLARHFVSDEPPAALVSSLAEAYLATDGHLPSVYRALVAHPEAWSPGAGKYKTPNDYILSAYRGLEVPAGPPGRALGAFELLGQRPWTPGSPAGWPDRAPDWDGPAALYKRVEWADALARRLGGRASAVELAPRLLGARLTEKTRTAIARADSGAQALTLLLACPEFLRR